MGLQESHTSEWLKWTDYEVPRILMQQLDTTFPTSHLIISYYAQYAEAPALTL